MLVAHLVPEIAKKAVRKGEGMSNLMLDGCQQTLADTIGALFRYIISAQVCISSYWPVSIHALMSGLSSVYFLISLLAFYCLKGCQYT